MTPGVLDRAATVPRAATPTPRRRARVGRVGTELLLWGYALVALAPLLVMLASSLRPTREVFAHPIGLPLRPVLSNYQRVWAETDFPTYLLNSVVVTVGAVVLGTAVSVLAAYPLGRYDFRGRGVLAAYFLSGLTLPIRLGVVPVFYLLSSLGMIDSRLGITLLFAASGVPFSVFVLTSFYRQLPGELEEAARLDGASELRIFAQVMLPLVRPAVATVSLFQFVSLWNEFFYPLVLLRSSSKATIPVGLSRFFGEFQTDWSLLFAGLTLATLPLVVLFLVATKQVVAGLTAGMSK